ncbi:MAG: DUF4198 domain-containing protein [Campylobacteraceae bacterium]|nr:DUF4198 domain-containing protein [Campylobacteraceae bacterium]
MKLSKLLLAGAITTSTVFAHGLWLNSFEASSHGAKLVTVGLGTGHNPTIEDSISDRVELKSFDLITPSGKAITLKKPQKGLKEIYNKDNLNIVDSNLAMQKISFKKESKEGTYTASLATKTKTLIRYLDKNDNKRFTTKSKDKIRNLKEVLETIQNTTFAKTYFVNKSWSQPKAVGHDLELIPTNDISKLHIGDTIAFKVLYKGKPLESGYITAKSAIAKNDNALFANVRKGKAKFVLTNFGQWMFTVKNKKVVDSITISNTASATINIK